jgi:hypothetical protein
MTHLRVRVGILSLVRVSKNKVLLSHQQELSLSDPLLLLVPLRILELAFVLVLNDLCDPARLIYRNRPGRGPGR